MSLAKNLLDNVRGREIGLLRDNLYDTGMATRPLGYDGVFGNNLHSRLHSMRDCLGYYGMGSRINPLLNFQNTGLSNASLKYRDSMYLPEYANAYNGAWGLGNTLGYSNAFG